MDNCVHIIYDPGHFLVSYATMLRSQALYQEKKKFPVLPESGINQAKTISGSWKGYTFFIAPRANEENSL